MMRRVQPEIPQKPEWKQTNYKDIVRDKHCFAESLPFPIVNYPNVYGTWVVFQEAPQAQPMLCACQREAAIRFLEINSQPHFCVTRGVRNFLDFFIPPALRAQNHLRAVSIEEFARLDFFRAALCHICNRRVPPIRWSNLDSHSIFLQHLGWYFHHALYTVGVSPYGDLLRSKLDPEIAALAELDPPEVYRQVRELLAEHAASYSALERPGTRFDGLVPGRPQARVLYKSLRSQTQRIHRLIEERMRKALGFPPHGKTGGSEVLLGWIVSALFPGQKILFRDRPELLGGLELDIFLPELRLAVEYQGEQHYEPFDHLGGERHFRAVRRRDSRKADLCKKAGIELCYFTVADKLAEDFVRTKLARHCKGLAHFLQI